MSFIKTIQILGLSSVLIAAGYAAEITVPPVVITYSNSADTTQFIKASYRTTLDLEKQVLKLFQLIVDAASAGTNQEVDAQFQAKKYEIEKKINKSRLSLDVFSQQQEEITINIHDVNGNQLKFKLHCLLAEALNIMQTNVSTQENASAAVHSLKEALAVIDNMLPSNSQYAGIEKFIVLDEEIPQSFTNQITLLNHEDSSVLIESLVTLNWQIRKDLMNMLHLAQFVVQGGLTGDELLELGRDYDSKIWDFIYNIWGSGYKIKTNIPLFHDMNLQFRLHDKIYNYFFPKIDLAALHLDSDNILEPSSAWLALDHIVYTYTWLTEWIITGNTLLSNANTPQQDFAKILSVVDLNVKKKAIFLEKIKNFH